MTDLDKRNVSDEELSYALDILEHISDAYRYEKICQLNAEQKKTYKTLLDEFKELHELNFKDEDVPRNLHNLKGEALEKLVVYLLEISGGIFVVKKNLRTATNEIDQVISLSEKGKVLFRHGLLNSKYENLLGECKNYDKAVSVTYIGKFCSLLLTTNIKIGILFSYHGVSGKDWSDGKGLIKKFYLHKERMEERYCIINFSVKEFDEILDGKNLLQILDEQLKALQYDTDYSRFLSKHPAENQSG